MSNDLTAAPDISISALLAGNPFPLIDPVIVKSRSVLTTVGAVPID